MNTVNEMLNTQVELLNKLETALAGYDNVLLGQGFLVVNPNNIALAFDMVKVDGGYKATNARPCGYFGGYSMFTKKDALLLSKVVSNGAGEPSTVKHVREFLQDAIEQVSQSVNWIKSIELDAA